MAKKYTKAQQKEYCASWLSSGQSKVEFCKRNNISKSALYKWLGNIGGQPSKGEELKFLPVGQGVMEHKAELEMLLPNGILVRGDNLALKDLILELSR